MQFEWHLSFSAGIQYWMRVSKTLFGTLCYKWVAVLEIIVCIFWSSVLLFLFCWLIQISDNEWMQWRRKFFLRLARLFFMFIQSCWASTSCQIVPVMFRSEDFVGYFSSTTGKIWTIKGYYLVTICFVIYSKRLWAQLCEKWMRNETHFLLISRAFWAK